MRALILVAGLAIASSLVPAGHAAGQQPEFDEQILFRAGTGGYSCFRIPAIVQATDGTLLAFAEGRVADCGDDGNIDVVLRRSSDGGRTWGPVELVLQGMGDTRGNPAPVVDRRTGRVLPMLAIDGIHIGQRLDGIHRFRGSIDEVRVYARALTPSQTASIHEFNEPIHSQLRLWLRLDRITSPGGEQ